MEGRHITRLLADWRGGDESALEELTPLVFDELKHLARRAFRSERPGHTLQPTALLNEAFEKLVEVNVEWQDRAHFYALASRMMRRILVNHAKGRKAAKRGGDAHRTSLTISGVAEPQPDEMLLDLDEALAALAQFDQRKASIVELAYFGGMTYDEIAASLELSTATVHRDLRTAEAWLKHRMTSA
jgi:RNA polymerase sigma factor (TIGR02999 family)